MAASAPIESWAAETPFERMGVVRRALRAAVLNPLANHLPPAWLKGLLRFGRSELALSNWADPGGWRSMVISYDGAPRQVADKILVGSGAMSMALRNRRRLGARVLAGLIDTTGTEPVHVLCLGAGPGRIIMDAMGLARRRSVATLVDLSNDAFAYGREQARREGLLDRVHFIEGDVRDVERKLDRPPAILKMLGICEYLSDAQIRAIVRAAADVMPAGAWIVLNSLSPAHGNDRFFRRVFGLHMTHRTPRQLEALLAPAGFGDFVTLPEPLGVYHVLVGRRDIAGDGEGTG